MAICHKLKMTARGFEPRDVKNCIMSDREHERMNDTLVNCRNNLARAVVALAIGLLLARPLRCMVRRPEREAHGLRIE